MPMNGWTLLFGAAVLCIIGVILADIRRRQHEQMYKKRMRESMLYYEIYPLVVEARKHDLDRVQIERSRVIFYAVCPPGEVGSYVLSEHGHRPLNAHRTWALTQVLADDLPILQEYRCYRFRRYRVTRPNGQKDDAYQFIIRQNYKTDLMYARQRKPRLF